MNRGNGLESISYSKKSIGKTIRRRRIISNRIKTKRKIIRRIIRNRINSSNK